MNQIIMFTSSYPYSNFFEWKAFELSVFLKKFDQVYVAPLYQLQQDVESDLPEGVKVLPPVVPFGAKRAILPVRMARLISPNLLNHLKFCEQTDKIRNILRFFSASSDVDMILRSVSWCESVAPLLSASKLYFFWGREYATVLPYLPREQQAQSLVRMHRWDLYPDLEGGYIPYQQRIVESARIIAPVSEHGTSLLKRLFPSHAARIRCMRLGTKLRGESRPSDDQVLRIVSCAYARPVKRLHLIAQALGYMTQPVIWTHLGDGTELDHLRDLCRSLPAGVKARLLGRVDKSDIAKFYEENPCDVFVNTSSSEGVPVSIMEAMGAGIPVLATDVGGNSEIVGSDVGELLPADLQPQTLADALNRFNSLEPEKKLALRRNCRALIEKNYNIEINASALADALAAL
jgi:colanic acid/amylovoran biosynthesis glycosyltransferase